MTNTQGSAGDGRSYSNFALDKGARDSIDAVVAHYKERGVNLNKSSVIRLAVRNFAISLKAFDNKETK